MEILERLLIEPLQLAIERTKHLLPQLFAAVLIVLCGMVLGWLVKVVLRRLLVLVKFDAGCQRLGLGGVFGPGGDAPSLLLARLGGGLVVLVFLLLAVGSIDYAILQHLVERFLAYLPNVLVAVLVVVVALLLGNFLGRAVLIACVNAGNRQARLCARLVRVLIVGLGVVMALEQLGIGKEAVLLTFAIAFGGLVLALAIAFGLGGRDLAREYLQKKFNPPQEDDPIHHL